MHAQAYPFELIYQTSDLLGRVLSKSQITTIAELIVASVY